MNKLRNRYCKYTSINDNYDNNNNKEENISAGICGGHAEDSHAESAGWSAHRTDSAAVCPH